MGYTGTPALPASLEFLGRPFTEPLLTRLAAAYEQGTQRRVDPPTTPSPKPIQVGWRSPRQPTGARSRHVVSGY
jgi:hypothetical protein